MLKRAKLWLLYKTATWVWGEKVSFEKFAGRIYDYGGRANPGLYGIGDKGELESLKYSDRWYELQKELTQLDEIQGRLNAQSQEIASELMDIQSKRLTEGERGGTKQTKGAS